jgi:hypothetical protein
VKFLLLELLDLAAFRNAERYKIMPETFLRSQLHPRQQDMLCFQQDVATAHTAQISIQLFSTMFKGTLTRGSQKIRFPILLPPNNLTQ